MTTSALTARSLAATAFAVALVSVQAAALDEEQSSKKPSSSVPSPTGSWEEVKAEYGAEIKSRGWDRDYVLATFDHDDNGLLDEEEYRQLVVALQVKNPDRSATAMGSETDAPDSHLTEAVPNAVVTPQEKANATLAEGPLVGDSEIQRQREQEEAVYQVAIEDLQGKTLNNLQREPLGQVEEVVVNPRAGTLGLVVRFGGILRDDGTTSVVPIERVELTRDNKLVWNTTRTPEQIREMAEYRAEDYEPVSPNEFPTLDAARDELLSTARKR
ncbi:hypothetical protein F6455_10200 [Proteobacteria bacterium 005FR1]|nr:hypothetical protein [Proteobacteria bacterium 005FR1]